MGGTPDPPLSTIVNTAPVPSTLPYADPSYVSPPVTCPVLVASAIVYLPVSGVKVNVQYMILVSPPLVLQLQKLLQSGSVDTQLYVVC